MTKVFVISTLTLTSKSILSSVNYFILAILFLNFPPIRDSVDAGGELTIRQFKGKKHSRERRERRMIECPQRFTLRAFHLMREILEVSLSLSLSLPLLSLSLSWILVKYISYPEKDVLHWNITSLELITLTYLITQLRQG